MQVKTIVKVIFRLLKVKNWVLFYFFSEKRHDLNLKKPLFSKFHIKNTQNQIRTRTG